MFEFYVKAIKCSGCASRVTNAIKSVDNNAEVVIDLDTKRVGVHSQVTSTKLEDALAAAGYPATIRNQ